MNTVNFRDGVGQHKCECLELQYGQRWGGEGSRISIKKISISLPVQQINLSPALTSRLWEV